MNKNEFLRRLEKELSVLDPVERKEILDFYEERFHTGMHYENKTESEVITDLEHPSVIAKNVLDEYGVPKKFVKTKEERFEGVNAFSVVMVVLFDVFIASWVIPTLFSVMTAFFVSSLTWIPSLSLVLTEHNIVDQYAFALILGVSLLLFMFTLAILDLLIWTVKKTIIWHLNVFKVKKREKFIKKASRVSVESFFKKHRGLRFIKNVMLIGGVVTVAVSGYWIASHYDLVKGTYTNDISTETHEYDFSTVIEENEEWTVLMNVDAYDVDIKYSDKDTFELTHKYYEKENFEYKIDEVNHQIYIKDIDENAGYDNFVWGFTDLFSFALSGNQELVLYIPKDLAVESVDVTVAVGHIDIRNVETASLEIDTAVGAVVVTDSNLSDMLSIDLTTGSATVKNVTATEVKIDGVTSSITVSNSSVDKLSIDTTTGDINVMNTSGNGDLNVSGTTGDVEIKDVAFVNYKIEMTTGTVELENLNTLALNGASLDINVGTGDIELNDVYVDSVYLDITTGDVDYHNELHSDFTCTTLEYDVVTGETDVTVGTK